MSNDYSISLGYGNLKSFEPDEPSLHHFFVEYETQLFSRTSMCEAVKSEDSKIYVIGIRQDCIEGFYENWIQCTEPKGMVYFCKDCLKHVKKMI